MLMSGGWTDRGADPMRAIRWLWLMAPLLGACSDPGDIDAPLFAPPSTALPYDVAVTGLPDPEIAALAEQSLALYRLRDDGVASPAFLRRRAQGDLDILQKLLRSRGYYDARAEVTVTPQDPDSLERARALIAVTPGPLYTLARHDLQITGAGASPLPPLDPARLGSPVGGPAVAAEIVKAENAAVAALQSDGFAYAAPAGRKGTADRAAASLAVDSTLFAGPRFAFGPLQFEGLESVDPAYLASYIPWTPGAPVDPAALRAFQQALAGTQLFNAISAAPPDSPAPATGPVTPLPIIVRVEEALPQTVTAGLGYDTDNGPGVQGTYQHRNLFGANETLDASAEVALDLQRLGFSYREPQYLRPGQDLLTGLALTREADDAFDAATATATLGLERRLSPQWVVGLGGLLEFSDITGGADQGTVYLAGLPGFATFDGTDDLLNPSTGERARLELTPFVGSFDGEFAPFLTLDATGSTYHALDAANRYVLAARARFGAILADSLEIVPPTRRLYAGGGGSVRGYAQRFVGPLDATGDPTGGRSALELGGELRARLYGDFGGVVFVEAGSVSESVAPDFAEGVQVAAGIGFRYYSLAGPIRMDFGVPLNGRDSDDAFQVYFSIGQAF